MTTKIVTVSELKASLATVMTQLIGRGLPVYVTLHGKPKAVLIPYEEYEALLDKVDDLEDALAMEQALHSPEGEAVGLETYERRRVTKVRG